MPQLDPAPALDALPVGGMADGAAVEKYWQPKQLSRRHVMVLQLHAGGHTNKEISEEIGISESRVSVILHDPRAKEIIKSFASRVAEHLEDVHVKLALLAPRAVDKVAELMDNAEKEDVQLRSARDILDRAYGKPESKVAVSGSISHDIADRLEKALGASEAIDAEYSIVEDEG